MYLWLGIHNQKCLKANVLSRWGQNGQLTLSEKSWGREQAQHQQTKYKWSVIQSIMWTASWLASTSATHSVLCSAETYIWLYLCPWIRTHSILIFIFPFCSKCYITLALSTIHCKDTMLLRIYEYLCKYHVTSRLGLRATAVNSHELLGSWIVTYKFKYIDYQMTWFMEEYIFLKYPNRV